MGREESALNLLGSIEGRFQSHFTQQVLTMQMRPIFLKPGRRQFSKITISITSFLLVTIIMVT